tara:strand:+ start:621 stop:824 length:204 start_codon:yes stop_codon:yes gene_type:complete
MAIKNLNIDHTEIVVNRQALLDMVRTLDIGATVANLPAAMDLLREPFFTDEISGGTARTDFSMNEYS